MRYREGETVDRLANHASDDMFIGTTIYGLLLGIGFVYVGLRYKQRWLAFWGFGLSLASIASMVAMAR